MASVMAGIFGWRQAGIEPQCWGRWRALGIIFWARGTLDLFVTKTSGKYCWTCRWISRGMWSHGLSNHTIRQLLLHACSISSATNDWPVESCYLGKRVHQRHGMVLVKSYLDWGSTALLRCLDLFAGTFLINGVPIRLARTIFDWTGQIFSHIRTISASMSTLHLALWNLLAYTNYSCI